jgi:hypothetical protein
MRRDRMPAEELRIDAARLAPPSPDELRQWAQNNRVFVSSVMTLPEARMAAIEAVESIGATPVAWELITPAPVAPEDAWYGGVESSHVLIALLSREYGIRRSDGFSATHAEFRRAEDRGIGRFVYLDATVGDHERDGDLQNWVREIRSLYSYGEFRNPDDLGTSIRRRLTDLAAVQLYTWVKIGNLVIRADRHTLRSPTGPWTGASAGELRIEGHISDPAIQADFTTLRAAHRDLPVVVEGQLFDGSITELSEGAERGFGKYTAVLRLQPPRVDTTIWATYSASGRTWTPREQAEIATREVLGLPSDAGPHGARHPIAWNLILEKAGRIPSIVEVAARLTATEALIRAGAMSRLTTFEARLTGPPAGLALRAAGTVSVGQGLNVEPITVQGMHRLGQP